MRDDVQHLLDRLEAFASQVIDLVETLPNTLVGRHIAGQLLRSGTSTGANYEECCGAESHADFVHKMQIVLKEMRESRYWLRMLSRRKWANNNIVLPVYHEADELCRIFTASLVTAKKSPRRTARDNSTDSRT